MVQFTWAAGSGSIQLNAGDYIARVEILAGQLNQADRLSLVLNTPTEERSWSAIKALYR